MQYYSAKLRLGGNPLNEVRGVYSAPEVLILQYIHGVDSLLEMKKVKEERMNLREYKDLLKMKYDSALIKREQSVDKIFGALGQIPVKLPDHLLEQYGLIDEDDLIAVAKSVTQADKNERKGDSRQPKNDLEVHRVETLVPQNEVSMADIME